MVALLNFQKKISSFFKKIKISLAAFSETISELKDSNVSFAIILYNKIVLETRSTMWYSKMYSSEIFRAKICGCRINFIFPVKNRMHDQVFEMKHVVVLLVVNQSYIYQVNIFCLQFICVLILSYD